MLSKTTKTSIIYGQVLFVILKLVCLGELPAARCRRRLRLRTAPVSRGQQQPADAGVAAVPGCDGSGGGLPPVSRP